jgi:hypothetical protein
MESWVERNRERAKVNHHLWYEKNKTKIIQQSKANRELQKEEWTRKHNTWRVKNRAKIKIQCKNWRVKNPHVAKLRGTVYNAFKRLQQNKPAHTEKLLGCSWQEAKEHFERLFKPGMTWQNHGQWHIDHIKPVSKFTKEDMHLANHISNLQPLWALENLNKANRVV